MQTAFAVSGARSACGIFYIRAVSNGPGTRLHSRGVETAPSALNCSLPNSDQATSAGDPARRASRLRIRVRVP